MLTDSKFQVTPQILVLLRPFQNADRLFSGQVDVDFGLCFGSLSCWNKCSIFTINTDVWNRCVHTGVLDWLHYSCPKWHQALGFLLLWGATLEHDVTTWIHAWSQEWCYLVLFIWSAPNFSLSRPQNLVPKDLGFSNISNVLQTAFLLARSLKHWRISSSSGRVFIWLSRSTLVLQVQALSSVSPYPDFRRLLPKLFLCFNHLFVSLLTASSWSFTGSCLGFMTAGLIWSYIWAARPPRVGDV